MNRLAAIVRTALAWVTIAAPSFGEELEQVREGVHQPEPPKPAGDSKRESRDDDRSFGEDFAGELAGDAAGAAIGSVVGAWFSGIASKTGEPRFTGQSELYRPDSFEDTNWFCRSTDFVSSARALVEYGTDYSDMQSVGTRLQVDFPLFRSTIDASWSNYYEDTPAGTDHLGLGDVNLVYRIHQDYDGVVRLGAGVNWLADGRSAAGLNFTTGFDALLWKPLLWSTDFDFGTLGDANLFRVRTTIGAQWLDGELYTGFEYVDIKDAQIPQMLFGFRYWW